MKTTGSPVILNYYRTNVRNFSLHYQGPKIYNSLSSEIQNASSTALFNSKLKGQMNQKIEIFSFPLYLHQTLKRTILSEIWVKIFRPIYRKIKDQNPNISEDFAKTFLKWPRDRLETT